MCIAEQRPLAHVFPAKVHFSLFKPLAAILEIWPAGVYFDHVVEVSVCILKCTHGVHFFGGFQSASVRLLPMVAQLSLPGSTCQSNSGTGHLLSDSEQLFGRIGGTSAGCVFSAMSGS